MLFERKWFQNTDANIVQKLFNLPEACNGFLEDLAIRPEQIGKWTLSKISEIFIPFNERAWNIYIVFEIKNQNDEISHFQYHSWQKGPSSGVKGIVLIKDKTSGKISHFVLLQGYKFGAGVLTFDCIGGFAEDGEENEAGMTQRFRTEMKEELGLPTLPPHQIVSLGRFNPDAGISNNRPFLMVAIVSSEHLPYIETSNLPNPSTFENVAKIIVPVSELARFVDNCEDSFFHVCITRLLAKGITLSTSPISTHP